MTNDTKNTNIFLDSKTAIFYLNTKKFSEDLKNEDEIKSSFTTASKDFLDGKINTLLFCSIVNKLFYKDRLNFKIDLKDKVLYFLLLDLSELQYHSQTNDNETIAKLRERLHNYLKY